MAETIMERKVETRLGKLLHGRADGIGVALRGCPQEIAGALPEHIGGAAIGRIRLAEPCRVEHPHSAFLRKPALSGQEPAVQTTLFAPKGKLVELRSGLAAVEAYVRKPQDFETLRGYLKDLTLHPARGHADDEALQLACLGLTPLRELETRWAGPELAAWALISQDESAASCLRKMERHLHRRAEEACHLGCRACVLGDMAELPLPETYMMHAGRHIEWLRHAGLFPYVEVSEPGQPLLAALDAAGAGVRIGLSHPALHEAAFAPPAGLRFLLDVRPDELQIAGIPPEQVRGFLEKCGASVVFLLDCFQAGEEEITGVAEMLLAYSNR